jgi:hypothetical protein
VIGVEEMLLPGRPASPSIRDYYRDDQVRARIREYASMAGPGEPGCVYLAALTGRDGPFATWYQARHHPPETLDRLLEDGSDLARSMWDRSSLIVHLDVDYLNADFAGEAFAHPSDVFEKLEPVYTTTRNLLHEYGLPLLSVVTGEGYHFIGQVPWDSPPIARLADLSPAVPAWLSSVAQRHPPWVRDTIGPKEARAYAGLGMLVEHVAHRIMRESFAACPIPIVLNGTVVGRGGSGRECVSLDISFAGEPLDARHIRVAFGGYQKHRWRPDMVGETISRQVPPLVAIPRAGASLREMLAAGRGTDQALILSRLVTATIPTVTDGIPGLIDDYLASPIAAAHRRYHAEPLTRADQWPELFDRYEYDRLPSCVAAPLVEPNDRLLQPACIQHVTRAFLAMGWPARRIASLIQSRYAKDFGWGNRWSQMDAETKADFDVRVFSTLLYTGLDEGIDFNCVSAQEKHLCPTKECRRDLRANRDQLLRLVAS